MIKISGEFHIPTSKFIYYIIFISIKLSILNHIILMLSSFFHKFNYSCLNIGGENMLEPLCYVRLQFDMVKKN